MRFLLIAVLLCSAIWGSLVFFGAAAIEKVSKIYFGEAVVLKHIKVSPSLSVSIGRVDFDFEKTNGFHNFYGAALGLNFKIFLFGKNPYFEITTTKILFNNWGSLNGSSIVIKPKNIFDLNLSDMEVLASSFELIDVAEIKSIYLESTVNFSLRKFQQIEVKTSDFRAIDTAFPNVESVLGSIDNFSFDQSISEQKSSGELILEGVTSDYGGSIASSANFNFVIQDGNLSIGSTISEIQVNDYGLLADELALSASINLKNFSMLKPIEINSKFIRQEGVGLKIDHALFNLRVADGVTILSSTGNVLFLDLYSDDQYLGSLNDMKFNMTSSFNTKDEQSEVLADFQFNRQIEMPTTASLKVTSLVKYSNFYNCNLVECIFHKLNFGYVIDLDGEFLEGRSECVTGKCSLSDLIHNVSINNTENFFNNLVKAKIFSPFTLAVLYSNAISGTPVGRGHLISLP